MPTMEGGPAREKLMPVELRRTDEALDRLQQTCEGLISVLACVTRKPEPTPVGIAKETVAPQYPELIDRVVAVRQRLGLMQAMLDSLLGRLEI